MRKQNPNDVIDDFVDLVQVSLATWTDLCGKVGARADLKKNVSVDAFLNAAIGWESFLNDWHIAAINKDSSAFAQHLTVRTEQTVLGRWPGLAGLISVGLPKHPSLDVIRNHS